MENFKIQGRVFSTSLNLPLKNIEVSYGSYKTLSDDKGNFILEFKSETENNTLKNPKNVVFEDKINKQYSKREIYPFSKTLTSYKLKNFLGTINLNSLSSNLIKEQNKLSVIPTDIVNQIKSQTNKNPLTSLQNSINNKSNEIVNRFLPILIAQVAAFGISNITKPNPINDKSSCPPKDKLLEIIRQRNKTTKGINNIYNFINSLTKASQVSLTLIQIFKLIKSTTLNLPIPQAIGTPPAKDFGGLIFSQLMSTTLKNSENIRIYEKNIQKYENFNISLLAGLTILRSILKYNLDLIKVIDNSLQACLEGEDDFILEKINKELVDSFEENKSENANNNQVNGFIIKVITDSNVGSLVRKKAIATNQLGGVLLEGEPSFSSNEQILIDELKFYIQQNNLKAN